MKIPVSFWTAYTRANKNILVDSGATDNFIDLRLIRRLRLGTHNLERAQKIWNINGTNNKTGLITNYVDLSVQTGQKQAKMRFLITDLEDEDLILGYPWLANFEPKFSWSEGVIDTAYLPIIIQSLDWETQLKQDTICYILVECSAWCELDGYNSNTLHIVLEACTSDTLWELLVCWCMDGTGLQGRGRYLRHTRCSGGICMFCTSRLDWHENSDLRSKSATGTT